MFPPGKKSACDGYVCDYHARCVVYKDRPKCECRQCTQEHDPVRSTSTGWSSVPLDILWLSLLSAFAVVAVVVVVVMLLLL